MNKGEQMRTVISKYITLSVLIIALGGYSQAEDVKKTATDKAKQEVKKESKKTDNDALPIIKLKVDKSGPTNPKLKKGKGCEDLEEANGEIVVDIPEAETIPCDAGGCDNLKPASLSPYDYKDIPTVKTDGSCEE
jgi:hypothetical protein